METNTKQEEKYTTFVIPLRLPTTWICGKLFLSILDIESSNFILLRPY